MRLNALRMRAFQTLLCLTLLGTTACQPPQPVYPGLSALHVKKHDDPDSLRLQLQQGWNPNETTGRRGRTRLSWAADRGLIEEATLLLDSHADPNAPTVDGRGPLSYAAYGTLSNTCDPQVMSLLLSRGALVNHRDLVGKTPIFDAARSQGPWAVTCVRLLLDHGARVDIRTRRNQTVLDWASSASTEVIQLLVAAGAEVGARSGRRGGVPPPVGHPGAVAVFGGAALRWVEIPGGSFTMGCTPKDTECDADEHPPHAVKVAAFALAATETTNAQYRQCVEAGRCEATSPQRAFDDPAQREHPVVLVSWEDAVTFCEWVGGRLPSEAEWECAARGGNEGWKFPWGKQVPTWKEKRPAGGVFLHDDRWPGTAPVGSYPANGYGLYDMAGNVWEHVQDRWHDDYLGAPDSAIAWESGTDPRRVLRGGSWCEAPGSLRVSHRDGGAPAARFGNDGFRCARTGASR